ncbi:MAG: 50S ribosomal protein L30 [Rickettsia endosymbiont of Eriopis connexa]|nr:50S ribosomal protein L30 [Rickettsia endosymbiont of Eriopis connexa]
MNNKIDNIKVTQVKSAIGRKYDQRSTLIGLGLNKINKSVILQNTNSVKGMIEKVKHLLKTEICN